MHKPLLQCYYCDYVINQINVYGKFNMFMAQDNYKTKFIYIHIIHSPYKCYDIKYFFNGV